MTDAPTPEPTPSVSPKASRLIDRVKDILLQPSKTWDVIATEQADVKSLYLGYVLPLAAIGPVATLIGTSLMGRTSMLGITVHTPLMASVSAAIITYVLALVMVYVLAMVINALTPTFGGEKNFIQALKLAVYANTAGWVAAIFGLIPMLGILSLLSWLYGLYLMFLGLPRLMKSPSEKSPVYMIVLAIVMFVMFVVSGLVVGLTTSIGLMGADALSAQTQSADKVTGSVAIPGVGTIDVGKMQEAAQQMEAQAQAVENGTSTITVADTTALIGMMPQNFRGAARSDESTQSGGAAGVTVATAEARYAVGDGNVTLKISDLGAMGGLGAMVAAVNVNSSTSSATGYEKIATKDGRMETERYDNSNRSGSYGVVYNGRISVEADGNGVDMATMKALVDGLDHGKLKALSTAK